MHVVKKHRIARKLQKSMAPTKAPRVECHERTVGRDFRPDLDLRPWKTRSRGLRRGHRSLPNTRHQLGSATTGFSNNRGICHATHMPRICNIHQTVTDCWVQFCLREHRGCPSRGPCKRRWNRELGSAPHETAPCEARRTHCLSVGGLQPIFQESPSCWKTTLSNIADPTWLCRSSVSEQ